MDNHTYTLEPQITPKTISIDVLRSYRDKPVKPIDGFTAISNITVPEHLRGKKRPTESADNLVINIRQLFNSLSRDNLPQIKEQLRTVILEKAKTSQMIEDVAEEILQNFIISEQNISNYMHLLNAISLACVLISQSGNSEKKNVSTTIGNFFLRKCKNLIFSLISEENIKRIAQLDPYDEDELDEFNREKDKIINLIITICYLYEQRNTANHIKLTANHLHPLMITIFTAYRKNQERMAELGNPYNGEDCADESEYDNLRKVCTIYAEQLYTFISKQGESFNSDETLIKDQKMKDLVDLFRNSVVPTLTEEYLISKCQSMKY